MEYDLLRIMEARRSIRKFQEEEIPDRDLEKLIYYASMAPSACNDQNYRFVAIKNKEVIHKMAESVLQKLEEYKNMAEASHYNIPFAAKEKFGTVFQNAPVVIAVFMTPFKYYDQEFLKLLRDKGLSESDIMGFYSHPDIQSMGAAIQNLILAACYFGYATCWMTDPLVAKKEISDLLSAKDHEKLIALIAIGKPMQQPKKIPKKPLEEIFFLIK